MLYCLVLGDAIEQSFLVKVSRDLSVSDLRDTIKEKKKPYFDDVPADRLKLWMVNIPVDDIDLETKIDAEDIKEQLAKENKLSTFRVVGTYFKEEEVFSDQQPNNHAIRIIIQPDYATGQKRHAHPEPVELEPKRRKTLSDFNELIIQLSDNTPPQLYPESKQGIAGRFRKPGSCIPISGEICV